MDLPAYNSLARPVLGLRLGWQPWLGVLIVAAHIVLAVGWGLVVPLGEGPDEPGHIDYALFLAREGRLPVQQAEQEHSDVPGEGHQPPLAYWLMQPAVRWLPADEMILEMGANPRFMFSGGDEPNAFFRSSRDTWPYGGVARAWHLARAVSALLGGLTVALCFLIARRVWPDQPWIVVGSAALVALNPQFVFANALASNDPLLFALGSGLLLCSVRLVTDASDGTRGTFGVSAVAGVLLGAMLVTKQSALAFVPLPLLALVLRPVSWRTRMIGAALIGTLALALSGWWYVRNVQLYGDWLGLAAFQESFAPGGPALPEPEGWNAGLWNLLRSSWGAFGWLTLPLNDGAYRAFSFFLALGGIGLIASVGRGWWAGRGRVALVLLAAVALALGWTFAFALVAGPVGWQGRFLFPASAAMAVLLAVGLVAVLPRGSALLLLIVVLAGLSLVLPAARIVPAYPSYVLQPQGSDFGNVYGRFDVGWKRGIELRDVEVPRSAPVGGSLPVTLTWHALEQADRPWTVFVHLVTADKQIVDEHNAEPLAGAFPTNGWVRGDWVRDIHLLELQNAAPGTYNLWIGLWDENSGARLGVYDRGGNLVGDRVEVGPITITGR